MKCKSCKRDIPDNSIFCNWCGERQIKERKTKSEIKVPEPRQLSSGKWNIQLRAEKQSITEDTADLCRAKARAVRAGFIAAKKKIEDITLLDACNKYIDSRRARLTKSSANSYECIVRNNFQVLMPKKVANITDADLDAAVEIECARIGRRGKRQKPKTVVNAYNFIITVLRLYNKELGKDVKLPEIPRQIPVLVPAEKIIPVIVGTEIELPCLLAMWLSMSLSEILGLTKSKSVVGNKLIISETLVYVNGRPERRDGGKEKNRTRAYDIPPYIMGLINKVETDSLVTLSGPALTARFKRLLQRNGLPHMSFHKLRHLGASVSAYLGNPDIDTQERGGWKTDYTMKRVYLHSFSESRKQSDAKINNYFEAIINTQITNENTNAK